MTDQPVLSPIQPKRNVLFGLPEYLKDSKNYLKVKKVIIESLAGKHSHGEIVEWAKCYQCQRNFSNHREVLKALGFRSVAQYFAWQKVHETIMFHRRKKLKDGEN